MADYIQQSKKDQACCKTEQIISYVSLGEISGVCK